eukprot:139944_1
MFPKYRHRRTVHIAIDNKPCYRQRRNRILAVWILIMMSLIFVIFFANYSVRHRIMNIFHGGNVRNFQMFQIGFNKCGTRSIATFFDDNGIPSIHWIENPDDWHGDFEQDNIKILSKRMFDTHIRNLRGTKLMGSLTDDYMYFGDFGVYFSERQDFDLMFANKTGLPWYELLLAQYPYSVYILNIRNVNHWLKSRYIHYHEHKSNIFAKGGYLRLIKSYGILNIEDEESDLKLLNLWKTVWYQYICETIEYFKTHDLMDRLIIFDVENDDLEKLTTFFDWYGVKMNQSLWNHIGKSDYSRLQEADAGWDYVVARYPQFAWWSPNNDYVEWSQIIKRCQINDTELNVQLQAR